MPTVDLSPNQASQVAEMVSPWAAGFVFGVTMMAALVVAVVGPKRELIIKVDVGALVGPAKTVAVLTLVLAAVIAIAST